MSRGPEWFSSSRSRPADARGCPQPSPDSARARSPNLLARLTSPPWVQGGLDGGWLPWREQQGGREGTIGVVASPVATAGKHGRHRLSQRRQVATLGTAEAVGRLTYAAAGDLGAAEAPQPVVLGDGADWTTTQASEHFPEAVKILDWPHLWRKVQAAVRALQPGRSTARRVWRQQQYAVLLALLWAGEHVEALPQVRRLGPATGEVPPAVEAAIGSLESHQDWVGNYAGWQEQGYPLGSGLGERAGVRVIQRRMKKRGRRWKRANAPAGVALRVHWINAAWEPAAASHPLFGGTP